MGRCNGCNGNKSANKTFDYVKDVAKRFSQVEKCSVEIYQVADGFEFRPVNDTNDLRKVIYTIVYK